MILILGLAPQALRLRLLRRLSDCLCKFSPLWKRLQVLNQISPLLSRQSQTEPRVVVIDDVKQRREASVVIVTSLVSRVHEETILTHKDAREIHRLVDAIR